MAAGVQETDYPALGTPWSSRGQRVTGCRGGVTRSSEKRGSHCLGHQEGFLEEMTREPCLMMRALQSVMGTGKGTPGRGNSMSKDSEAELSNGERRAMGRQRGLTVLGM